MKVDTRRVSVEFQVITSTVAEVKLRHPQIESYGAVRAHYTGDREWVITGSLLGPQIDRFGPAIMDSVTELLAKMAEVMEDLGRWGRTLPAPMAYVVQMVEHDWGLTIDWPRKDGAI